MRKIMNSFLNKIIKLFSKPRMVLIFILILCAAGFLTLFEYTLIKSFLIVAGFLIIYPAYWLIAMFGYVFIVRPFNFLKNKFKK
jgi:hypothetical protein